MTDLPPEPTLHYAELLAARALVPNSAAPTVPLQLDDIVRDLRAQLHSSTPPEFDLMLTANAHLINMAFNRLMIDGLSADEPDMTKLHFALHAQRTCVLALNALERRQARLHKEKAAADSALVGKRTEFVATE